MCRRVCSKYNVCAAERIPGGIAGKMTDVSFAEGVIRLSAGRQSAYRRRKLRFYCKMMKNTLKNFAVSRNLSIFVA